MPDAVVLALANTLAPSIETRSGQKFTDVRMSEDLWWWYADGAGCDRPGESRLVLDLVMLSSAAMAAVEKVRWRVVGVSCF